MQNQVCDSETDELLQLLRENQNTEYGKKYKFSEIHSIQDYQKMVPLTDYSDYREYVERMYQGEKDILTAYPIASYCHTSGATGETKKIPLTREALGRYGNEMQKFKDAVMEQYGGKRLSTSIFRTDPSAPMEKYLLFTEVMFHYFYEQNQIYEEQYPGGLAILFQTKECDMMYARLWAALATEDLTLIESGYLYDVLHFFQYLEKNWEDVLEHMCRREVDAVHKFPEDVKEALLSLKITKERTAMIKRECENGFEGIALRLWPGLKLFCGSSHPSYCVEDEMIRFYIGEVPVCYFMYAASECYFGAARECGSFHYPIRKGVGFFEYLEAGKEKDALISSQVQIGKEYELILTNYSGLYRYRIGDVVRIEGREADGELILSIVGRKNQALNIGGEKVSFLQLEQAVRKYTEQHGTISEYCFLTEYNAHPSRYVLFVCGPKSECEQKVGEVVDGYLRELNCDYDDLRDMQMLGCIKAVILSPEEYQSVLTKYGLNGGHTKPRHAANVDVSL